MLRVKIKEADKVETEGEDVAIGANAEATGEIAAEATEAGTAAAVQAVERDKINGH